MKEVVVVVDCGRRERAAEALRAAVGLGLRGDRVRVFLRREPPEDRGAARALATLEELGRPAERGDDRALARALRRADAVEVWR